MRNLFIYIFFTLLFAQNIAAQTPVDTTLQAVPMTETVISATRQQQGRNNIAQQVKVLNQNQIEQLNSQTTADLMQNSGAVFMQKSQQGGGSPVLRGFEASRVLLVVDGVRMNNAIYRAGHLQNIVTMDNAMLERIEVLFGPASTVYGSDALGGAICFFTKNPTLAHAGEGLKTTGNTLMRYSAVNEEKTVHADISLGSQRFGSLTSVTYSDFGDLRMGRKNGSAPFFGLRSNYVETVNGVDMLVRNEDPYIQRFSGYQQVDFMQKFLYKGKRTSHLLNAQYSTSSNIPRYDRLTDPGANGLNSAEWYYGPQERLLAAYTFTINDLGVFDGFTATASYQDIQESRHNRNFGAARRTSRIEDATVLGLLAELYKSWNGQNLRVGIDGQYNDISSTARRTHIGTGEITNQSTRYPDGGSTMTNAALFTTHAWACGDKWRFSEGLRLGYATLDASWVDKSIFDFPFDNVSQKTPTWSASLGATYTPDENWLWAGNLSTGFRVPNVDDMGKVFDTQPGKLIVPNPDLGPEQTYNADLGITRTISDKLRWENVIWGTLFRNAIVAAPFQFNGQDVVDYDGTPSAVLAYQNQRKARLVGYSSILEADAYENLAIYGSINFTQGKILSDDGNSPLDHIPPTYGRLGMRWHTKRANAEGFALWNGKKALKDYNLEGEDNLQYAPADGMPSWMTLNLRGGVSVWRGLQIQAGIDNILDTQYRTFASGINGPGRNVWVAVRAKF